MSEHDETDPNVRHIALAMSGEDVVEFIARIHHVAYVRGCQGGFLETLQSLSEKIKGLEEELAGKSKNDPYVMGEISALAQFAATVKAGADSANFEAIGELETLRDWCKENDLTPLLIVFSQAIRKRGEAML